MEATATRNKLVTPEMLQGLPEPVQRYLAFTGVIGKPWIRTTRIKQAGQIRLASNRPWMPISAVQTFTTDPPGFAWKARVKMFGLPLMSARDSFQAGRGHMFGKLAGIFTIFNERGSEMDQSSMVRYLSEIMWFPTAFLGKNITWQGIDEHSSQVTLTDCGKSVSARLSFDEDGRPTSFTAPRYYEIGGHYTLVPWFVPMDQFQVFDGLNIPVHGQVIWKLPSGDFYWFDWEVKEIEYNAA